MLAVFRFFLVFAFGENIAVLFIARAIQGIGSSCTIVSGELITALFT